MKSEQLSREEILLARFALVLTALLLALTLSLTVYHRFYSPDGADIANLSKTSESYGEFCERYFGGGVIGRFLFYTFFNTFGGSLRGSQALASLITFATFAYLLFIARKYFDFRGYSLLIPALVAVGSSPFIAFGTWGFFTYALTLFFSLTLVHVLFLLLQNPLPSPGSLLMDILGLSLMVALVIHAALSAVILLFVLFVMGAFNGREALTGANRRDLAKRMFVHLKTPLLIGIPVLAFGFFMLAISNSPDFKEPRRSLWPLYFTRSDQPMTPEGAATFIATRIVWFCRSAFAVYNGQFVQSLRMENYRPGFGVGSVIMTIGFGVGVVRSLFLTGSLRFALALYVLLTLAATLVLSLLGIYPFGSVRYTLFLLGPILLLASLGLSDGISCLGSFLRFLSGLDRTRPLVRMTRGIVFVLLVGIVLKSQIGTAHFSFQEAKTYNQNWKQVIREIEKHEASAMVVDYYSRNLIEYALPDFSHPNTFVFPRAFMVKRPDREVTVEEWQAFLDRHDEIFCVMFNPLSNYPKFNERVTNNFRVVHLPGVRWWYLSHWERISPYGNRLSLPNRFEAWDGGDGFSIVASASGENESEPTSTRIALDPGGNLYHFVNWHVRPGLEAEGSIIVWAESPCTVGLSIERHGSTPSEGSSRKWVEVGPEPTRIEVFHRFAQEHSMVRLRLWAPPDRPATFHARDAVLRKRPPEGEPDS